MFVDLILKQLLKNFIVETKGLKYKKKHSSKLFTQKKTKFIVTAFSTELMSIYFEKKNISYSKVPVT